MNKKLLLPLDMEEKYLYLESNKIDMLKKKLENFLKDEKDINSIDFAKKVLLTNEVQSNNSVEGYFYDIEKIKNVISNGNKIDYEKEKLRILNLSNGYKFILDKKEINKDNLKALYSILSKNLLDDYEISNMGNYYRLAPVYIYYSKLINVEPSKGINFEKIDDYMNKLFEFINSNLTSSCLTDEYIKAQILHYYFVYIHPYFDINGRTSRTTAIWHLLNKEAYSYVIFNRGINLNKQDYYKAILKVSNFGNISYFIEYMLKTVLVELQKEHIIQTIKKQTGKLNAINYQTIHYLLSMNGNISLCDFTNLYNKFNKKKNIKEIYFEMIEPLLDLNILLKVRETKKMYDQNSYNFIMKLNPKYIDDDPIKSGELKNLKH